MLICSLSEINNYRTYMFIQLLLLLLMLTVAAMKRKIVRYK